MITIEKLQEKQQLTREKIINLKELIEKIMKNSEIDFLKKIYQTNSTIEEIQGLLKLLESNKITISVVAEVSQGKSTFLNALIFKDTVLDSGRGAVTARLFKVEHSDEYTISTNNSLIKLSSLEELKNSVKNLNENARDEINQENDLTQNCDDVLVTLPNEMLQKGVAIYDTPGFGSLDETLIYKLIQRAVSESDATILLIDISKGIKKNEMTFIKDVMKSIVPEKRYVVLNRFDEVISEDQKLLMSEEEIQEEISNVEKSTVKELAKVAEVDKNEITTYMLSSLKALAGYKSQDIQRVKESRFDSFEEDFWKRVVTSKDKIYNDRIEKANNLITHTKDNIKDTKEKLLKNLKQLKKLLTQIHQTHQEFSSFSKNAQSEFEKAIKESKNKQEKAFDKTDLYEEIEEILCGKIYDSINKIGFKDKLNVLSLKDKYIQQIEEALEDSMELITPGIEVYVERIEETISSIQNDINDIVNKINIGLDKYKENNIDKLENINLVVESNGHIQLNMNKDLYNDIGADKEVFVLLAGILGEIAITRATAFIPGIGLAVSVAIMTGMAIYKKYADPNKELARNITDEIMKEFKKKLNEAFKGINEFGETFYDKLNLTVGGYIAKLENVARILENPEIKEDEIQKLTKQLQEIETYLLEIEKLKS